MERKIQTVIRTALLVLALVNQILSMLGKSPIPVADEQLSELLSLGITIGASVWAWWKNNSVTREAQAADIYLDALKAGGKYHDE